MAHLSQSSLTPLLQQQSQLCKNRLPATPEGVSTGSQPVIIRQELLSEPNAAVCIQQRSRAPQIVCQVIISPRKVIFSATPATKRCSLPQCPSAIHFLAENGQLARPTLATWRLDHEGKAVYTHAQESGSYLASICL